MASDTDIQFANQLLDRRVGDPLEVITQLVGVYSTAPTSHLALIARLDGYAPTDLNKLVLDERSIVRMGAMRGSGFYIPTKLVPTVARATEARRERVFRDLVGKLMDRKVYEKLATKIEKVLSGTELTTSEIRKAVKDRAHDQHIRYVIQLMTAECRVVQTRTAGTWRSNLTYNALWSDWLPKVDPWKLKPDKARRDLARLYFAAHGPATVEDLAWWSGLKGEAEEVVDRIEIPEVRKASPASGVRLLPIWDGVFLTHRDRTHVVPQEFNGHVYDRSGNPTSVVLVDGMAAGQWDMRIDKTHHEVKVAPFTSFSAATWKEIDAETARLGEALGAPDIEMARMKKAPPLRDDWNRFMSPLKDL
jgi:hypothetical protein